MNIFEAISLLSILLSANLTIFFYMQSVILIVFNIYFLSNYPGFLLTCFYIDAVDTELWGKREYMLNSTMVLV